MTLYARLHPDTAQLDVRDFATPQPASKGWRLLALVLQPSITASQVAELSISLAADSATQVWTVRAKTQGERDAEDDVADRAALQASAVVGLLKAEIAGTSALTAAQFRVLAARCLLFLVRRAIGSA